MLNAFEFAFYFTAVFIATMLFFAVAYLAGVVILMGLFQ